MTVLNVARASVGAQTFAVIRESTLERNLSYVMHAAKASVITQTFMFIRVHTGEKPFKCEECRKDLRQSSKLCIRGECTLERNYKCRKCGKDFSQSIDLQVHQRVHTRETLNVKFLKYFLMLIRRSRQERKLSGCQPQLWSLHSPESETRQLWRVIRAASVIPVPAFVFILPVCPGYLTFLHRFHILYYLFEVCFIHQALNWDFFFMLMF